MSGFKSDAQRKHFFANHGGGGGGGGGVPSFPDVSAMTAEFNAGLEASGMSERDKQHEREYFAFQMDRLKNEFVSGGDAEASGGANVDGPAAGGRNPMPRLSEAESAMYRAHYGFGK